MAATDQQSPILRILHKIWVVIRTYFFIIGLCVTLIPIGLAYILSRHAHEIRSPSLGLTKDKPGHVLLNLGGPLLEKEPGFSDLLLTEIFGGERSYYLPDIRKALRRASKDERINGLDVEMGAVSGSPAEFAELRRIFAEFSESGKFVRVVLADADNWSYFAVAVPGVSIVLNPTSSVMLPGPYFQLTYFGEALRKLGVQVDVLRAGKYKSAFEPFVTNEPTEPTLEEYRSMEQSLRDYLIESVAAGRKQDPAKVRQWFQHSIYTVEGAKAEGIIDEVGYSVVLKEEGEKKSTDANAQDQVLFADYAAATADDKPLQESVKTAGGIALIEAVGEITMNESASTQNDAISPRQMREQLHWALGDDEVKAVVLRISSPGGSATASDLIWQDVDLLAQAKPVVVSMGAYAASGGYYIAAPARRIIAEPTSITGSIGVIGALPSFSAFKEKYGVSFYAVTQSDRRALFNPGAAASPQDKALMDASIDETYKTFIKKVGAGRKMAVDEVDKLAQGRVYTGLEAKKLGLVDDLGGLQAAFDAAKELAGFDVNKLYPILHYEKDTLNLADCLGSSERMMKCLNRRGVHLNASQISAKLASSSSAAGGPIQVSQLEATAWRARQWIAALHAGETLALWPGYLGTNLR